MAFQPYDSNMARAARFMGFRSCPKCKETLFAAEAAVFVVGHRVQLHWKCDSCEYVFTSSTETTSAEAA
jgi:transposase-like protein